MYNFYVLDKGSPQSKAFVTHHAFEIFMAVLFMNTFSVSVQMVLSCGLIFTLITWIVLDAKMELSSVSFDFAFFLGRIDTELTLYIFHPCHLLMNPFYMCIQIAFAFCSENTLFTLKLVGPDLFSFHLDSIGNLAELKTKQSLRTEKTTTTTEGCSIKSVFV